MVFDIGKAEGVTALTRMATIGFAIGLNWDPKAQRYAAGATDERIAVALGETRAAVAETRERVVATPFAGWSVIALVLMALVELVHLIGRAATPFSRGGAVGGRTLIEELNLCGKPHDVWAVLSPNEWLTAEEISRRAGLDVEQVKRFCRDLAAEGEVEESRQRTAVTERSAPAWRRTTKAGGVAHEPAVTAVAGVEDVVAALSLLAESRPKDWFTIEDIVDLTQATTSPRSGAQVAAPAAMLRSARDQVCRHIGMLCERRIVDAEQQPPHAPHGAITRYRISSDCRSPEVGGQDLALEGETGSGSDAHGSTNCEQAPKVDVVHLPEELVKKQTGLYLSAASGYGKTFRRR